MLSKSLESTLLELMADEGKAHALQVAQHWQVTLEGMSEAANQRERVLIGGLLARVNNTIGILLEMPDPVLRPYFGSEPGTRWPLWVQRGAFWICCRVPTGKPWPLWWDHLWERVAVKLTPVDGF